MMTNLIYMSKFIVADLFHAGLLDEFQWRSRKGDNRNEETFKEIARIDIMNLNGDPDEDLDDRKCE